MSTFIQSLGLLVIALFSLVLSPSTKAASVLITNVTLDGSTNAIVSSSGALLNGSYVGVGYFSGLSDSQIQLMDESTFNSITTGSGFQALESSTSWWAFGAGLVDGNAQGAINSGSDFIGEAIYSIIGNGATLATSTELLIFKFSAVFAQDEPIFSANAKMDVSSGNGTVLWGGTGNYADNYFGEGVNPAFNTVGLVPEPSRVFLLMLGLVGLMMRRRR